MSLNSQVSAERVHIGFFGMRNAGKSSLVNALTNQSLSVVSDVAGTTTDPVRKAMEILPLGPVVIIDTPGFDDVGELGLKRVKKTKEILAETDIAVLVVDSEKGVSDLDKELIELFKEKNMPFIIAFNKNDLFVQEIGDHQNKNKFEIDKLLNDKKSLPEGCYIDVSAKTNKNIYELKEKLADFARQKKNDKKIISDLIEDGDVVLCVIPIDESAPKGRLILPQQMVLRDVLDCHCSVICCQHTELKKTLGVLSNPPKLVVTDSQVFKEVSEIVPEDMLLTSFSILFARYRGDLRTLVEGAKKLEELRDGDKVVISEACTHQRQCNDIGTVKLPGWIEKFSGAKPEYEFTSGGGYIEDFLGISLVVHCGGCMINENKMQSRIEAAKKASVPIVNYGIAIAHMQGILKRTLEPFPERNIL